MSDSTIHLKLDRILAGQEQILRRIADQDETIATLNAVLATLTDAVGTQTEVINRLSDAMSEELDGGDTRELLKSIAASLKQIKEDGSETRVMLGRLAPTIAQAAQDAVFMAMGDGVDISKDKPE